MAGVDAAGSAALAAGETFRDAADGRFAGVDTDGGRLSCDLGDRRPASAEMRGLLCKGSPEAADDVFAPLDSPVAVPGPPLLALSSPPAAVIVTTLSAIVSRPSPRLPQADRGATAADASSLAAGLSSTEVTKLSPASYDELRKRVLRKFRGE